MATTTKDSKKTSAQKNNVGNRGASLSNSKNEDVKEKSSKKAKDEEAADSKTAKSTTKSKDSAKKSSKKATEDSSTTKTSTKGKSSAKSSDKSSSNDKAKSASKDSDKRSTSAGKKSTSSEKVSTSDDAAKNLEDLYEDGLKDIYWAEKALKKALPKMEANATSEDLKAGIRSHLEETKEHIKRLEKCFKELGVAAEGEKCDAMAGLLEEAESLMEEAEEGAVRDVAIIAAAQKVEHYEIATYGTLAAFAKVLGYSKGIKHLIKTLDEEKACDELLSSLADTTLNSKAE